MILIVTPNGYPARWVDMERAVYYMFKDAVLWHPTDISYIVRGGINADTMKESSLRVPAIMSIRNISHNDTIPSRRKSSKAIFLRDSSTCAYCGSKFFGSKLTLDHIVPQAQNGSNEWTNLVTSCFPCNNRKGNRTPEEAQMPLLTRPYLPTRAQYLNFIQPVKLECQQEWINNYI